MTEQSIFDNEQSIFNNLFDKIKGKCTDLDIDIIPHEKWTNFLRFQTCSLTTHINMPDVDQVTSRRPEGSLTTTRKDILSFMINYLISNKCIVSDTDFKCDYHLSKLLDKKMNTILKFNELLQIFDKDYNEYNEYISRCKNKLKLDTKENINLDVKEDKPDVKSDVKEDKPDVIKPENKSNTGIKFDQGKPEPCLLSSIALMEMSKVATLGAKKYGPHNWRKGMKWSRILNAVMRHILQFQNSEDPDEESGVSHLAHAAWGLMALIEYQQTGCGTNDLYQFNKPLACTSHEDVKKTE